jgi:hypothetical protein
LLLSAMDWYSVGLKNDWAPDLTDSIANLLNCLF